MVPCVVYGLSARPDIHWSKVQIKLKFLARFVLFRPRLTPRLPSVWFTSDGVDVLIMHISSAKTRLTLLVIDDSIASNSFLKSVKEALELCFSSQQFNIMSYLFQLKKKKFKSVENVFHETKKKNFVPLVLLKDTTQVIRLTAKMQVNSNQS